MDFSEALPMPPPFGRCRGCRLPDDDIQLLQDYIEQLEKDNESSVCNAAVHA